LAAVGEVSEGLDRVSGDRHGDIPTTVDLLDERIETGVPSLEGADEGDRPLVVDHERDQNVTIGEESGGDHVYGLLSDGHHEPIEVCARPASAKLKAAEDVFSLKMRDGADACTRGRRRGTTSCGAEAGS